NTGTFTDGNGNFRINATRGRTLVFSFLGFETQEIVVQNNTINVSLNTTSSELETVVVVGYNTVKKSDLTGAVATVSSEQMIRMPVSNPLQALQGITPGVDITSNERPGEVGSVRIRGERSISAGNNPLYVVDGIPLSTGGIEFINPSDIESVNVLKDASATAIYGSRGANGVILITTKNGRAGGVNLNYNGRITVESMHDRVEMMNSAQYIEFRRDAYRRLTTADRYPDVPTEAADQAIFGTDPYAWANVQKGWVNGVWDGTRVPTTDWTDFVLQTGVTQDHYLSASGGTDKIKSYGSFGYLDQEGTQLGQDYRRFSSKYSADIKATKWFSMGGSLNATYGIQNYGYATTNATGPGNLYFAAQGMLPFAVPYDESGQRIMLPGGDINILNPIDEDKYNINERKVLRAFGSFFAEAQITEGLRLRVNFGPEFYNNRNGRWMDENSINRGAGNVGSTNYAQLNQTNRFAWTLDNLLYYDRTIDKHNFGLTLLQSTTSNKTETSTMTATDLPWNSQKWNQLNSVSELDGFGTNLIETQLLSYMGRVNYSFNDKYLLTASARWDGASQLAEGNKWDFFPSAAVAWRLDQEDFIKNQTWINQLKLRLGYGITGNAAIDPYATKGAIETLYYTWGNLVEAGYVSSDASLANPISMANLGLGWEKTKQYNLGFDFGFWNDRLNGSIDLYSSTTDDILLRMAIPSV
ncbi:SusC/RagA family TonB-linked outer membrane protein, partial [Pseudoxanthomonas sp. SGD-10]